MRCAAFGCNTDSSSKSCKHEQTDTNEIRQHFFQFPTDKVVYEQWIRAVASKRSDDRKSVPYTPSKRPVLCHRHFEDACYEKPPSLLKSLGLNVNDFKPQLLPDAVPTIFPEVEQTKRRIVTPPPTDLGSSKTCRRTDDADDKRNTKQKNSTPPTDQGSSVALPTDLGPPKPRRRTVTPPADQGPPKPRRRTVTLPTDLGPPKPRRRTVIPPTDQGPPKPARLRTDDVVTPPTDQGSSKPRRRTVTSPTDQRPPKPRRRTDDAGDEHNTKESAADDVTSAEKPMIDFTKLYGELYQRLLNTPAAEIFPQGMLAQSPAHIPRPVTTGNTSPLNVHSAFPFYGACAESPAKRRRPDNPFLQFGNSYPGSPGLPNAMLPEPGSGKSTAGTDNDEESPLSKLKNIKPETMEEALAGLYAGGEKALEGRMNDGIDIQKLVDEFRVTLEKYGVSQRFAARFIMQDTSQGNLSFLMEKGRSKRWEELSPRGRIPYIKMKHWLESSEQQMLTLEMLKRSQEMKKAGPRETYSRRERFSMFQLQVLCRLFEENPNPAMNIRNAVATRLNIPLDRVNVWFQNQRARGFPAKKILQQSYFSDGDSVGMNDTRLDMPQIDSWMKTELYDYGNMDTGNMDYFSTNNGRNDVSKPGTSKSNIAGPLLEQQLGVPSSPSISARRSSELGVPSSPSIPARRSSDPKSYIKQHSDSKSCTPQPLDLSASAGGGTISSSRAEISLDLSASAGGTISSARAEEDQNCSTPVTSPRSESESFCVQYRNGVSSDRNDTVALSYVHQSPCSSSQNEHPSDSACTQSRDGLGNGSVVSINQSASTGNGSVVSIDQSASTGNGSVVSINQSASTSQNMNTSGSHSGIGMASESPKTVDQSMMPAQTALELELKASQSGAAKRKRGIKLHQLMQMRTYESSTK